MRSSAGAERSEVAAAMPQTTTSSPFKRHIDEIKKRVATLEIRKRAANGASSLANMISPEGHETNERLAQQLLGRMTHGNLQRWFKTLGSTGSREPSHIPRHDEWTRRSLVTHRHESATSPVERKPVARVAPLVTHRTSRVGHEACGTETGGASRMRSPTTPTRTPSVTLEPHEQRELRSGSASSIKLPLIRLLLPSTKDPLEPWDKADWEEIDETRPVKLQDTLRKLVIPRDAAKQGTFRIYPRIGDVEVTTSHPSSKVVRSGDDILQYIKEHQYHRHWNVAETYPDMSVEVKTHDALYGIGDTSRASVTASTIAPMSIHTTPTSSSSLSVPLCTFIRGRSSPKNSLPMLKRTVMAGGGRQKCIAPIRKGAANRKLSVWYLTVAGWKSATDFMVSSNKHHSIPLNQFVVCDHVPHHIPCHTSHGFWVLPLILVVPIEEDDVLAILI
eukprot:CAMPEP_0194026200 /NCGR_PEP_ID=MMETSP0009_2-20130614/506_1 /TAXON_ID=210454 /ORGANISM="Grammatophora oceanica, Strain CCMP 410" /LENGTH=446 /DNA_ID=CAMNT_0038664757 /DNA_START=696 /DNA_END=2036 /DNA_ORIENTATION=+